jgi:hypothetical protein
VAVTEGDLAEQAVLFELGSLSAGGSALLGAVAQLAMVLDERFVGCDDALRHLIGEPDRPRRGPASAQHHRRLSPPGGRAEPGGRPPPTARPHRRDPITRLPMKPEHRSRGAEPSARNPLLRSEYSEAGDRGVRPSSVAGATGYRSRRLDAAACVPGQPTRRQNPACRRSWAQRCSRSRSRECS